MVEQEQFLDVIDREEAERRFHAVLNLAPLAAQDVPLAAALGRVLAGDVVAECDVPSFDRSNYDGFAVRAADTFGAREEAPRELVLSHETLSTGVASSVEVAPAAAVGIATGGMLPRGADAVVMVEHADVVDQTLIVRKAVTPGFGIAFAGTDIARGETVLRRGELLTSRETGVLAAIGVARVSVYRVPRVAILSTGDELIAPGEPMRPPLVYDSNAQILADAVREIGGEPDVLGIVADQLDTLRQKLREALDRADVVLLSGGTSKGQGDLSYHAVEELKNPGIVAHGVALKPGKPICLAGCEGKPVVVLPGFPTSAIFTFHEFVAPVIRSLAGRPPKRRTTLAARAAMKLNSEIGRTEYLLVGLVQGERGLLAYPMGKGSGSVTTFSHADGFVTIGRHVEIVEAGAELEVQLIGRDLELADLVIIGSHCIGLDAIVGRLHDEGIRVKLLAVGSTAGLEAARRGECDVAGVHLLDPKTNEYNRSFMTPELDLVPGYRRRQGIVFRPGDARFEQPSAADAVKAAIADPSAVMVNRNQGSGTRILIDRLLAGARPPGYAACTRSHNAVAAAIAQGRADWGVAIEPVALGSNLGFLPLSDEQYDFAIPKARRERPAVAAFCRLLEDPEVRARLDAMGFAKA